jgi:succinate-semialdehyde dehydrogenase / glutarate-semialdehyde dehydrogenase
MKLPSINPATGEALKRFDEIGDADLEAAPPRAEQAFRVYRRTSVGERAGWLHHAARGEVGWIAARFTEVL